MSTDTGTIASLQLSLGHGIPMKSVDTARLRADYGVEGDRHARSHSRRQVLLIEAETLDDLGLRPGQVREQITTRGIELEGLPRDTRLLIGDGVELWVTGPCHPCRLMDDIRDGLQEELRGRRGTLAWVKAGGTVRVGDPIRARPAEPPAKAEVPTGAEAPTEAEEDA